MNFLFYPHYWKDSFLQKDVGFFSKETLGNHKIIRNSIHLFMYSFVKIDKVVIYHLSLRNIAVYFLARVKKFDIILKADLNTQRTENIVSSRYFRKYLFKYMIQKSKTIIIETNAEYNDFVNKMNYLFNDIDLKNVEFRHNKALTNNEFLLVNKLLKQTLKKNEIVYYLRWNDKDNRYNYICGLDIFLKSLYLNEEFLRDNLVNVVGHTPEWLRSFILKKFYNIRINFLGSLNREDFLILLCNSKYFVLTSRAESYNLSFIEAVMCGCLVTSTYTGVARDFEMNFIDFESPIYSFQNIALTKSEYVYNFG